MDQEIQEKKKAGDADEDFGADRGGEHTLS
jgi:hypothetical protein